MTLTPNVYIFMGHGPELLRNEAYTVLLRNAVLWAAVAKPPMETR